MPPLFLPTQPNGPRHKLRTETNYEFHCRSERSDFVAIRKELEEWYSRFPDKAKPQWLGRFRGDEVEHKGAFYELFIHELLLRLGFEVEVDVPPPDGGTARIDFLVTRNGSRLFYMEATVAAPSDAELSDQEREAALLDGLDKLKSPNFRLALEVEGTIEKSPSAKDLRRLAERWLAGLDPDQVQATLDGDPESPVPGLRCDLVETQLQGQGWVVTAFSGWDDEAIEGARLGSQFHLVIRAYPKKREERGETDRSPIVCTTHDFRLVRSHKSVEAAVSSKAEKYGKFDIPFVVAVNSLDETIEDHQFVEALFGSDAVEYTATERGDVLGQRQIRIPDGALRESKGWTHKAVSAVLLSPGIGPFMCAKKTPALFHHPQPDHVFPTALWPLHHRVTNPQSGKIESIQGREVSEFFTYIPPP